MSETLIIDGNEVCLEEKNLVFNETTLTEYITKEGGFYDNFGAQLAKAERTHQILDMQMDEIYATEFSKKKDEGGSDKLAEAAAKGSDIYKEKLLQVINAKYMVARLKNHLRAWDKNHENAQSLGHMLRKEMDKLNGEIRRGNDYGNCDLDLTGMVKELNPKDY